MLRHFFLPPLGTVILLASLAGCAAPPVAPVAATPVPPVPPAAPSSSAVPAVFSMDNGASANAVLRFGTQADGSLVPLGSFPTGGTGTGGGLGNQAALALSTGRDQLLVVNPASNDFSVFLLSSSGDLTLASRVPSGGIRPISITEHNGVVYVLNVSGGSAADNISGFRVDAKGEVTPIANSTRTLSRPATGAAQVALSPDGTTLLVTERSTAIIDAFPVDGNGLASAKPVLNPSAGQIPFGFQFLDATRVLVSEEGAQAASSYAVSPAGELSAISRSVSSGQAAVCWLAITPDLRFAYTANTSANTLSGYSVSSAGALHLLDSSGLSARTDGGALDVSVSRDSRFLYVVLSSGALETFRIAADGGLAKVQTLNSLGAINGVVAL